MNSKQALAWPAAVLAAALVACSTNPVTGEKDLILVGEGTELSIGEKNYAPMRQAEGGDYLMDPGLTSYVQRVGNRLAAVSDRKLPYEFVVLNNTIPNAWALPGGKIAVNRGLLTQLRSESELAAVLESRDRSCGGTAFGAANEPRHVAAGRIAGGAGGRQRQRLRQPLHGGRRPRGATRAAAIWTRGRTRGRQVRHRIHDSVRATTRRARCHCRKCSCG